MKTNSLFFSTGNFNIFAILCAVVFMTVTIIVLIVVLSVNMKYSAVYHTNEEKRSGKRIWCWRQMCHLISLTFTQFPLPNHILINSQMACTKKTSIRFQSTEMNWTTNFPLMTSSTRLTRHHCNRHHSPIWYHLQRAMGKNHIDRCSSDSWRQFCVHPLKFH